MIGETLRHYRIAEKLGEGGMGEVHRALADKLEKAMVARHLAYHPRNPGSAGDRSAASGDL